MTQTDIANVEKDENGIPLESPIGSSIMPLGWVSKNRPIPPLPEETRYIEAGTIRIGVEGRILNDDITIQNFVSDPTDKEEVERVLASLTPVDDDGLSIHVFDAESNHEYLRFDMFPKSPHYHYLPLVGDPHYHYTVAYDAAACGNMRTWTLATLRSHLPSMLVAVGAPELADRVDAAAVESALTEVEAIALRTKGGVSGA